MNEILKEIASKVYEENLLERSINWMFLYFFDDEVLQNAQLYSSLKFPNTTQTEILSNAISKDPVFSQVFTPADPVGPMLLTPFGGGRINYQQTISEIFSAAFLKIFYLRQPRQKAVYVENVLEGFASFRNMILQKEVKVFRVSGLGRIKIDDERVMESSFGKIYKKPEYSVQRPFYIKFRTYTNCIWIYEETVAVEIVRGAEPKSSLPPGHNETPNERLQIAFALASQDHTRPCMPSINWSTYFFDFANGNSTSLPSDSYFHDEQEVSSLGPGLEYWSQQIRDNDCTKIDIAIRKICSAIGKREDPRDALIDAVMSWENMFGTHDEVTFRVCTAISKLIEGDAESRMVLKKVLSKLYGSRSRLVHGDDMKTIDVKTASKDATRYAIDALAKLLERGSEFLLLKSEQRSDRIICE